MYRLLWYVPIRDKVLECGFQTLISDPEGTREKADVYRLAVVRRLMENPEFGLKQILPLSGAVPRLRTASELNKAVELSLAPENQLPAMVFTCRLPKIEKADDAFQRFAAPKVLNSAVSAEPRVRTREAVRNRDFRPVLDRRSG